MSAKVYPNTDTIHCFTCNQTWTVESAYARAYGKPMRDAIRHTQILWPVEEVPFWNRDTQLLDPSAFVEPRAIDCFNLIEVLTIFVMKYGGSDAKEIGRALDFCRQHAESNPREIMDKLITISRKISLNIDQAMEQL